jgi:urocanate hydratase
MDSPSGTAPRPEIEQELAAVYRLYAAIARHTVVSGRGGKLLYAGELDAQGCRLVRGANIAQVASLAAAKDPALARKAIRDGVIDFLVTSLDEALRILKNEIRKHQCVAVGAMVAEEQLLREMQERGVLPDLLPPSSWPISAKPEIAGFAVRGARPLESAPLRAGRTFVAVAVPQVWVRRQAEFESLLLDSLPAEDEVNRQWLRLSPRFMGPEARRLRSLECTAETFSDLIERVGQATPD